MLMELSVLVEKCIPLQTSELKSIVMNRKTYFQLYRLFENAYSSTLLPHEWYRNNIQNYCKKRG